MINVLKVVLRSLPLAVLSLPPAAFADTITTYNTGVAADGSLLAPGTLDPNYTLIHSDDPNGTTAVASSGNPVWTTSSSAGWITPGANGDSGAAQGYYVYETTLDLTNYDPTTAVFSGCVSSDNQVGVYLNRDRSLQLFTETGFSSSSCFSITSGFVTGVNQIDYAVYNTGNDPSGLLVSNTSAYAQPVPAQTPEPESLFLLGTGALGTLTLVSKRRSR